MFCVSVCGLKNEMHPTCKPAPVVVGLLGHALSDVRGGNAARTCLAIGPAVAVKVLSAAVVGTYQFGEVDAARDAPESSLIRSNAKEKKVLSLRIGPETIPPNRLRMYFGLGFPAALEEKSAAFRERL